MRSSLFINTDDNIIGPTGSEEVSTTLCELVEEVEAVAVLYCGWISYQWQQNMNLYSS